MGKVETYRCDCGCPAHSDRPSGWLRLEGIEVITFENKTVLVEGNKIFAGPGCLTRWLSAQIDERQSATTVARGLTIIKGGADGRG